MRQLLLSILSAARRCVGGRTGRGYASLPVVGKIYRALLDASKPRGIVQTQFHGMPIYVDARDKTVEPILVGFDYNDPEIALCERYLKPGMTALDVGANIGAFTMVMARAVGSNGRVYSFEPAEGNFGLLSRNIEVNGFAHATATRRAVADYVGTATFHLSDELSGGHSLYDCSATDRAVEVDVTTLDAFFGDDPPEVHLMKIDVQGAEAAVLRGMTAVLERSPNMALITELDLEMFDASDDDPATYLETLTGLGWTLHHISHAPNASAPHPVTEEEAIRLCELEKRHINLYCVRNRPIR
ncbi:MAG: FkbM family methyltransferase [Candidatus Poribacteria bacterium]|nr:FkbM family methyltransferase [Candidatus Poribacteria bacterium]